MHMEKPECLILRVLPLKLDTLYTKHAYVFKGFAEEICAIYSH